MTTAAHSIRRRPRAAAVLLTTVLVAGLAGCSGSATAPPPPAGGGEANLTLPDLNQVTFLGLLSGKQLLGLGLVIALAGLAFGIVRFAQVRNLPAHKSMLDISEIIYQTCKTYLIQQGKFLLVLWAFIGTVIFVYFEFLAGLGCGSSRRIVLAVQHGRHGRLVRGGLVRHPASTPSPTRRTAFAASAGKPWDVLNIPLKAGMSIGMLLIARTGDDGVILLFVPGEIVGSCFLGFAIGESLGASALRIAGGIFTKIADIGSDLMKIVFKVKEDDPRNPGVIADCTGDNAGDSVGPTADGFETYGVTGVALITFIMLAVHEPIVQAKLIVWIFAMRFLMVHARRVSYFVNQAISEAQVPQAEGDRLRTPADPPDLDRLDPVHPRHLRAS